MILVIDNSKDLSTAEMTPRLLQFLHYLGIPVYVASTRKQAHVALRKSQDIRGVILSGGPLLLARRTYVDHFNKNMMALLEVERHQRCPVLGICFGMQLMATVYGGKVGSMAYKLHGPQAIHVHNHAGLFHGLPEKCTMHASHQNQVVQVPPDYTITAHASDQTIQAMEDWKHLRFGVQFHPEASEHGTTILLNFLRACLRWNQLNLSAPRESRNPFFPQRRHYARHSPHDLSEEESQDEQKENEIPDAAICDAPQDPRPSCRARPHGLRFFDA